VSVTDDAFADPVPVPAVEKIIGVPNSAIMLKELAHLDADTEELVSHARLAGVGYVDHEGLPCSRFITGDPCPVRVLDQQRLVLVIDDEPPPADLSPVGLLLLFPGVGEVLRINGRFATDAAEAWTIRIEEVYVHCSRAVQRARLWELPTPRPRDLPEAQFTAGHLAGPLDDPDVAWLMANAPFLIVSSYGPDSTADTSPRGDAAGFVHRIDGETLAIPDRNGNKRADTFHNLACDMRIAIAALVPGTDRIAVASGIAMMSTDPDLLSAMAKDGRVPQAALKMRVRDARTMTATKLREMHLWDESSRDGIEQVPNLNAIASKQIARRSATSNPLLALLLRPLNAVPGLMDRLTSFGLNRALVQEGYSPGPAAPLEPIPVRVTSVHRETDDTVSVRLRPQHAWRPGRFRFRPGQYYTIALEIDGRVERRSYSVSGPQSRRLQLTVRREPDGAVSNYVNERLRRGDRLRVTGPRGDFTPPIHQDHDLVLIGAGSGITPLYTVIRTALRRREKHQGKGRIVLIYGARDEAHVIFGRQLQRLARRFPKRFVLRLHLSRPSPAWQQKPGRISVATLREDFAELGIDKDASYWICGSDAMMDTVNAALIELGIPPRAIHEERFTQAAAIEDAPLEPTEVTIRRGTTETARLRVDPGRSILQAALDADVKLPYSCGVGNCGECAVQLLEGTVQMATPNCLTKKEIDDGVILTCVGRPSTPAVVVDSAQRRNRDTDLGSGFTTWATAYR
jgi:ferredoxin-NADP reductase/predicted pyridoxine 5'-phosphate oxidase superfamily flavin-nucleotide-binding protein